MILHMCPFAKQPVQCPEKNMGLTVNEPICQSSRRNAVGTPLPPATFVVFVRK